MRGNDSIELTTVSDITQEKYSLRSQYMSNQVEITSNHIFEV